MSDIELKNILKEYEQKRLQAQLKAQKRKEDLYQSCPRLGEIDMLLSKISITTAKSLLLNEIDSASSLSSLQEEIKRLKQEKLKLFYDLSLEESYLKPEYECSLCEDTGYVTENSYTQMCTCLKQKLLDSAYHNSNISNLGKDNFSNFSSLLYSSTTDKEKYHCDISPRDNIENIKKICLRFIENFEDPQEKNLLFTGNTGLGKTFLSNCIAQEMLQKRKTVLYQTAPVMLDTIISYKFGKRQDSILDTILDVDLLIIDDLGTEYRNDVKFAELYEILNTRLLNQENKITKTIISTNLTLNNLFSTYDERIVSRIVGYYNICRFFGDDIRFQKINP